nr:ParB N-terminal domain-containing protein [uncultured Rhodopila sp.]
MNARTVQSITLDVIDVGERLRAVDPAHVEALAAGIEARGLLSPIEVTPSATAGRYDLVAGAHRLAAVKSLGGATIAAFVRAVDDPHERRLIEIEENLIRHDLTALDRAVFLAEWKRVYTEMTGAKRPGRPKKEIQSDLSEFPLRFSEAVSERLRMAPSHLDRAIKRAALPPFLRAALAGHPAADNGAFLDSLLDLDETRQRSLAEALTGNPDIRIPQMRELMGRSKPPARPNFEQFVAIYSRMNATERDEVDRYIARDKARRRKKGDGQ